jgi:hydroxylamine reductase
VRGVCGKTEDVSNRMDLLLYVCKGISHIVVTDKLDVTKLDALNGEMLTSLFMTITNANFDADAIERQIIKMLALRDSLRPCKIEDEDAANFTVSGTAQMLKKADTVGVLATENEDVRSLRELVMYGLKGLAAYAEHARNLGSRDDDISAFVYEALAAMLNDSLSAEALTALVLKTGTYGVKTMALLDAANTAR